MRRASLLTALLLTAGLFCAMPGLLWQFFTIDENRMDERLRPAQTKTLTLWLLNSEPNDQKLLNQLCAAFEKEHQSCRIFLRRMTGEELTVPDAVLPDIVLYGTGTIPNPEQLFLPLSDPGELPANALHSGQSGGMQYGIPLWFSPNVLSLPISWTLPQGQDAPTQRPSSYFSFATPVPKPDEVQPALPTADDLPWQRLLSKDGLWLEGGVGQQQLLSLCPGGLRQELIAACRPGADAPAKDSARIWSLARHAAALKAGEELTAIPLPPAAADRVRYLSLCRRSDEAVLLLQFLLSPESQNQVYGYSLLPLHAAAAPISELTQALSDLYRPGLWFPNAYAHTVQELNALLSDAFLRGEDPVQTLLSLR